MSRIALLSEAVASQVAAGEVVERPASVVKELVENSLDAGATKVEVLIRRGGISSIRVVDDGSGMDRDDALLCLERHATSKIRTGDDLAAIHTLGFRGEALPSIASVSRFRLATREPGALAGTEVLIAGGRIESVRDSGDAPGTQIEVRQLFYNLPARRKFLRTENTEASHVEHQLHLQAIGHPGVGFVFVKDERLSYQLPPAAHLRDRVRDLCGAALTAELLEVPPFQTENGLNIRGLIGKAGVSRSSRAQQLIFLNGRAVENNTLSFALREGYHTALMRGQHPVTFLFIEMNPADVDVNVHPAKREVRFRHAPEIRDAVVEAVRRTLESDRGSWSQAFQAGPSAGPAGRRPQAWSEIRREPSETGREASEIAREWSETGTAAPGTPAEAPNPDAESPAQGEMSETDRVRNAQSLDPTISNALQRTQSNESPSSSLEQTPSSLEQTPSSLDQAPSSPNQSPSSLDQPPSGPDQSSYERIEAPSSQDQPPASALIPPFSASFRLSTASGSPDSAGAPSFRILGVLGRLYVLMENASGLVLVDQHAAHERILFEEMLRRMEQQGVPTQRLLLPLTLQVPPRDADWLTQNLDVLARAGIGLEPFGENTFKIDGLPPFLRGSEPAPLLREIIDDLRETSAQTSKLRLGEDMIAKTVCRHAVKANDYLREPELVRLIQDLLACDLPYCCPHGRPTMIQMSYGDLEKKFGRKV